MTSVIGGGPKAEKGRVLAVDDTPESLKLLTDILIEGGFDVRAAINGELALKAAVNNPPELALLDIQMPGIDGFEVCRRLKAHPKTKDVPVIFVSALSEADDKVQGFALGAVDFVTKPYNRAELLARVGTHLELSRLRNRLEDEVEARTAALLESERRLQTTLVDFVAAIMTTIEMRDPYTAGHQKRVSAIATAIARAMKLPETQVEGIYLASLVHDSGKIRIPIEILCNPGRLNDIEYKFIQLHPQIGYDILKTIDFPWPIAQIVLQHHERLNGSGYPHGLKGDDILLEARILAVADVLEAMASHRPYRAALGVDRAVAEITGNADILYDAAVAEACLKLLSEGGLPL
jgi:putative two-component system response regulator